MMNYVLVEKIVLCRSVDVHVARGAGGGVSDHFLEVAKVNEEGWIGFWRRKEMSKLRYIQILPTNKGEKRRLMKALKHVSIELLERLREFFQLDF